MTTAIAELDSLILLLEARIPASQQSPQNLKRRERLERELRKYFRDLEKAFPYSKLAGIYNRYVKESLGSDSKNILDPLLASFDEKLTADIAGQLAEIRISGTAEVVTWGKTNAGVPIAYEGPPIQGAIDWAGKHSAALVKGMNEETINRLAHTISEGIKNKRGVPGLARDIKGTFADMTKHRSELIARTETANALSEASLETMKDMGIDGKEWVTVGDDRVSDDCLDNEAEGVIPTNQVFSSGAMAPPEHPSCRCALAPAGLSR